MKIFLGWSSYNKQMELMHNALNSLGYKSSIWSWHGKKSKKICPFFSEKIVPSIIINSFLSPLILIKLIFIVFYYENFFFFAGKTLLPIPLRWKFFERIRYLDLFILKLLGKKLHIVFQGSDLRNYAHPRYQFSKEDIDKLGKKRFFEIKIRSLNRAFYLSNSILLTTPDLIDEVPIRYRGKIEVVLKPIKIKKFVSPPKTTKTKKTKIRIIHSSLSNKKLKGSDLIENAICNIKNSEIEIQYIFIQKKPKHFLFEEAQKCHIAIDQLILGSYGTFALEMLSMGLPVMCYTTKSVREFFLKKYNIELPILKITKKSCKFDIEENIKQLIKHNGTVELQKRIKKFLKTVHSEENLKKILTRVLM